MQEWPASYGVTNQFLIGSESHWKQFYACYCNPGQKSMTQEVLGPRVEPVIVILLDVKLHSRSALNIIFKYSSKACRKYHSTHMPFIFLKIPKGQGHSQNLGRLVKIEKNDNISFIQILLEVYKCITESVKHHIHFTGHGSQAKCSEQSLAEPTAKARDRPS